MATYVKLNDKVEGPFLDEEIREYFEQGRVTLETPAWKEGMEAWQTVGYYFSDLVASPAPSAEPFNESAEIQETLAWLNQVQEAMKPPPQPNQDDAIERLEALAAPLLASLENRLGSNARATTNYYAHRTVTLAIQRLRLDVLNGASLNQRGEDYLAQVAAYLGTIVISNWRRRGFKILGRVDYDPGSNSNALVFSANRVRDGVEESYGHDFLKDVKELLLAPKQMFPYMRDRVYSIQSLTMPSPESLYLFGVAFMSSPQATGNWPEGPKVGCLEEDFEAARQLMVDDLHEDCGIPLQHEGFRNLSYWIVFPPYGWDMNDAHDYNMMTFFSQFSEHKVVTFEEAIQYLRSLLTCQAMEIRLLAARCLMVLRIQPQDPIESSHYQQALEFRDYPIASECMAKYQCELEKVERNHAWKSAVEAERVQWIKDLQPQLSHRTTAESDPEYQQMEQNPPKTMEDGVGKLEMLMARYPQDWVLKALHASQLLQGPDLPRGESIMRELIQSPPDCFEAHSRFGTFLKYQKRTDEALAVYEEALKIWPWCSQASDACVWMLTDGMSQ